MPMVEVGGEDLLRGKILPPGWYKLHIEKVNDWAPAKSGTSNNCVMECVVVGNVDEPDMEGVAGVPIYLQFNDSPKAKGFIIGFLSALGIDVQAQRYDLASAQGESVIAFVENETYEGRIRNRVNHKYKKATGEEVSE